MKISESADTRYPRSYTIRRAAEGAIGGVKILLDENLPHPLRHELSGHEVVTAWYGGWAGVGDGELLRLAEEAGFDVLVTGDRNVAYQQN